MDALFLIGRILFGVLFIASGLMGHLTAYPMALGYAQSKRIPLAGPAVVVSGVGIVAGGLGVAIGVWPDLAALAIAVFLFFTAFFMHAFWKVTDQMGRIMELTHFQKDLALLGAALVFFAVTAFGGEFGPTVTDPLFDL